MLRMSLLKREGVQKYLDRLQEEKGVTMRDYTYFVSIDSDDASAYLSSLCGNRELELRIKINGAIIEIPYQFIDAVYVM